MIGDGDTKKEIEEKIVELGIERNVRFLGIRKDIPDLLSIMDAFMLPSLFEGMPNVLIEAQTMGLPCVVSDKITKYANITGQVYYLSLDSNYEEWVEKVLVVKKINPERCRDLLIKKRYSIDSVIQRFIDLVFCEIVK